ncbi:Stk1 family PASTA domain-containing Ser/Thr kinase [Mycetocola spongiae]|uniref:Stk1 family PASTA domain-containing Ser/Thr kinase n=1 Tax=Mycetocola spongiae TaxID=2859226 RepID=UPI001CF5DBA7|nr:Stk1 family PASTA domain-containing Ser/Thr kinase [Mycetocola spongiae]UCR88228.1 Stk1 family PASTA domain-containing Ser/Thr kinase [Mycetocola spongiae]
MSDENRLLAERYVVGALIGRGGMADVYQGTDTKLGRTVAIKILKADLALDPTFRSRFRQEAQAASRMAHPTIVRVYDAGEHHAADANGNPVLEPFIIMEFVSGRTLKSVISDGPLDPERAVRITASVLTALEYSHRAGVVHRDIKPGNIMLGEDDAVKVMDFGIARAVSDSSATVAQTTAILGTASYFSPEQAKGETVDARTDLYSTGVVLFEMLTGRAPFRGDTAVAVAYQHVSEAPVKPSEINPAVSRPLDMVVHHALAKNRDERYQTAAEFREELILAGEGQLPAARPEVDASTALFGSPSAAASPTEQALRQLTEDTTVTRTQRRPPVVWIWAGVVVVAVILVAVMIWVMSLSAVPPVNAQSQEIPDLVNMSQENATDTLRDLNLVSSVVEENSSEVVAGNVIRTDPGAKTLVERGSVVRVIISLGAKTVSVPNLMNLPREQAEAKLKEQGLLLGAVSTQSAPAAAAGIVLSTLPAAGEAVAPGSTVDLTVSDGQTSIQDVRGQPLTVASDTMSKAGLNVISQPDASCVRQSGDLVTAQSLPAGSVPQGSDIVLEYCTGATPTAPSDTPAAP